MIKLLCRLRTWQHSILSPLSTLFCRQRGAQWEVVWKPAAESPFVDNPWRPSSPSLCPIFATNEAIGCLFEACKCAKRCSWNFSWPLPSKSWASEWPRLSRLPWCTYDSLEWKFCRAFVSLGKRDNCCTFGGARASNWDRMNWRCSSAPTRTSKFPMSNRLPLRLCCSNFYARLPSFWNCFGHRCLLPPMSCSQCAQKVSTSETILMWARTEDRCSW